MDTQPDSNGALDINQAAAALSAIMDPRETDKSDEAEEPIKAETEAEDAQANPEAKEETSTDDDPVVTVKIDGKEVDVPLSELKRAYGKETASQQRFQAAHDLSKTAQAEASKAREERNAYQGKLQTMQVQLEAALQQQQQTDWTALLESDPVEYLKQQHLSQQRQATLQQVYTEQQKVASQVQAEQAQARQSYLAQQQDELLAKLPDWKDAAKAKAEKTALRDYLLESGYDSKTVETITDAKAVVLARKAMLYDQIVSKANAAAKKVSTLPTRVERPGVGENPGLDRRSSAFQKLSKTGRVEDATSLFGSFV